MKQIIAKILCWTDMNKDGTESVLMSTISENIDDINIIDVVNHDFIFYITLSIPIFYYPEKS